jgi:diguanylate cyclase (GGDEF)-like protein
LVFLFAGFITTTLGPAALATAPSTQPAEKLPTLTTARTVHDLTLSEAKRHYPVHLRAVCIICFADWHGFFVSDGVSGVYVETKNHALLTSAIHSGTWLDIVGVTGPGDYAPIVDQATLRILGEKPLPPARVVSMDRLSSGIEDGQWIAFEGTVRSAQIREGMLNLWIASGRLQVELRTDQGTRKDFDWLIHARVLVHGSTGPVFNQRGQIIGVSVYAPSVDSIQILQPAPADPFSIPISPVNRVFDYTPGTGSDHLVRIRGVVSARWGQTVFITDDTQGASILSNDMTALKPGDVVEAVGYPSLGDASHTIDGAIFRQLGTAPQPAPKSVTVEEALSGSFEGELVRLEGHLIEQQESTDLSTLLVRAGDEVFSAVLPRDLKEQTLSGLRNGSRIQLTGICVVTETKASRHYRLPKAFQILLRAPGDVVVLQQPTWWTTFHALVVLILALTGILVVLGWVVALRKQVYQQTILLRESESRFRHMALHDALTGLATRLLLDDRLSATVEAAKRHQTGLALLMLDLDKFKGINDTYGHHAGDEVLRVTADRLLQTVRKSDTVARMGGDEFIVLLPDLNDPLMAEGIAAKIVKSLAEPVSFAGREIPVSVSVGVCTSATGGFDEETLLTSADDALYQAKANGRNCFHVFAPSPHLTQANTIA